MTTEEKDILFKDLCGRLPYGVICDLWMCKNPNEKITEVLKFGGLRMFHEDHINFNIKPYLRPMADMTEKEYETFPIPFSFDSFSTWNNTILSEVIEGTQILIGIDEITEIIDWLNAHHFDYRSLIEKGLALEAPEGMYN